MLDGPGVVLDGPGVVLDGPDVVLDGPVVVLDGPEVDERCPASVLALLALLALPSLFSLRWICILSSFALSSNSLPVCMYVCR